MAVASAPETPRAESLETESVFWIQAECGQTVELGDTPAGVRRMIPILGGSVTGERLSGSVLAGGADWQLTRSDRVLEIDAHYAIRAADGAHIEVRNRGIVVLPTPPGPQSASEATPGDAPPLPYVRSVPRFVAPREGPHAWLNRSVFLGTLRVVAGPAPLNVRIDVFRVL